MMAYRKIRDITLATLLVSGTLFAAADWETAAELRKNNEIEKAEKSLKKYSSPAEFEQLPPAEKIEFLRGLLELAHICALQDDVVGSLALLNWAESCTDDYLRSIACIKYAEILFDLGEFDRAKGYLANADELILTRATDKETGTAIGQGGEKVDTGGAWRELRDESDALKADIESEEMKVKFGATYGSYVKLRRLQQVAKRTRTPRYRLEALKIADEIIETDPASQFAAAAGYLKGELLASRLKEDTPKKEIKEAKYYLEKFVKSQPDGLYRGEALMLLGKISLEIEWNAKDAEKYYTQALDYFQKSREKRDAVSLYAAINDDLKSQTEPTQKPTTLNQWKRIVYHDEDPLKLYNIANAPIWYIDDKEKNSLFALGFVSFSQNKMDHAKKYWGELDTCLHDFYNLDPRMPNLLSRLKSAANMGYMAFTEHEKKNIKSPDVKLRIQYAEFLYIQEKFDDAIKLFRQIFNNSNHLETKAICMTGMGSAADINFDKKTAAECFKWVLKQQEDLGKSPVFYGAVCRYADSVAGTYQGLPSAIALYEMYLKKYPTPSSEARYFREAGYRLINALIINGEIAKAKKEFSKFDQTISDGYLEELNRMFKIVEKHGRYEGGLQ